MYDKRNNTLSALISPHLYEGDVGIHTFELKFKLGNQENFKQLRDQFFKMSGTDTECGIVHIWSDDKIVNGEKYRFTFGNAFRGYFCSKPYQWLTLIINPRTLIGDSNLFGNSALRPDECALLQDTLDSIFKRFGFPFSLNDFSLSRVDLCANLSFSIPNVTRTLIKALKKTPWKTSFHSITFQGNDKETHKRNAHSFMIASEEEGIKIYDKKFEQMLRRNAAPDGLIELMRLEVSLSRSAIVDIFSSFGIDINKLNEIHRQLSVLFENSYYIMLKKLEKVFPSGIYLPKQALMDKIRNAPFNREVKEDMFFIVDSLSHCRVAGKAYDRITSLLRLSHPSTERYYYELMQRFKSLGVQPAPLAKEDFPMLPSPADLLICAHENTVSET